jgi:hypothetical protein
MVRILQGVALWPLNLKRSFHMARRLSFKVASIMLCWTAVGLLLFCGCARLLYLPPLRSIRWNKERGQGIWAVLSSEPDSAGRYCRIFILLDLSPAELTVTPGLKNITIPVNNILVSVSTTLPPIHSDWRRDTDTWDFFAFNLPGTTLPLGNWDPFYLQNATPHLRCVSIRSQSSSMAS